MINGRGINIQAVPESAGNGADNCTTYSCGCFSCAGNPQVANGIEGGVPSAIRAKPNVRSGTSKNDCTDNGRCKNTRAPVMRWWPKKKKSLGEVKAQRDQCNKAFKEKAKEVSQHTTKLNNLIGELRNVHIRNH